MELRPLLLSAILLAVTMSGCAGVEPVPGEGADEEPVQAVDDNATAEPIFVMNQLPNVTFEASTFEAAIPFTVNFTIDAVDADNDTMWWNLELGNETIADGEAFPAAANYTLIEAGNHTFRLIVNDGNNETVQEITVLAIDVFTVPEPIVFTGSAMIPDPYYAATGFECVGSIFSNGSSGASHDFNIAVSGSWIYHLDADGFTTLWTGPDSYQETDGGVLGVVPANTNRVYTCSESAVEVDYTMTFYHPLHSGAPAI
jgi:PKD repeat protein